MRTILTLALALTFGISAAQAADFFAPGFDSGKALNENLVYPQGRIFPFSGFAPADLAQAKESGYTMAGPVYSAWQLKNLLAGAEKNNLFMIYPIHPESDGKALSKQMLDANGFDSRPYWQNIGEQVKAAAGNKRIAWWYLTPEELRPWRSNDMAFLRGAVKAIRDNDPDKRPVWLYLPNHYTREQMRAFAENLDIVGKGMYPVQLKKENDRVWCRWSTESEAASILDAGSKAVPVCVPEMFKQPAAPQLAILEKLVRHDVYLSLVTGAKGVVVFSLAERAGFDAHARYYAAYAGVARELTGEKKLGELFLFGERLDTLKLEILSGPATLSVDAGINKQSDIREYPAVASAEIGYRDMRTLFLVNSSKDSAVKLRITGLPREEVAVVDLFSGETIGVAKDGAFETELAPYDVKSFRFIRK